MAAAALETAAVLAIDLGGTNLRVAVFDRDGRLLRRLDGPISPAAGPTALIGRALEMGRGVAGGSDITAVGVSCPGLIDPARGVVLGARNLGWRNVRLGSALARGLALPVGVENDVNLAALGECRFGAGRGMTDLAFISIGTGLGVGLVIDGRVYRGAHFAAGEVNPLPSGVPAGPGGPAAGLEDVASGPAIVRRAVEAGLPPAGLTTEAVFATARAGDARAARVIEEAITVLAEVVAWLIALVDPAGVVMGGGVSRQGEALLRPLREAVGRRVSPRSRILPSALGVDAQLYGAAAVAFDLARNRERAG